MGIVTHINKAKETFAGAEFVREVAGEDITLGTVVIKNTLNNKIYIADVHSKKHSFITFGLAAETVFVGKTFDVQISKVLHKSSWNFEPGKPVYLGDKGEATQIQPTSGFVQIIGIPYSSDSLLIDIEPAILETFYEPILKIFQNHMAVSKNQQVTFSTTNVGYALIEWVVFGNSLTVHDGAPFIGNNISSVTISSNLLGKIGAKFRIKDPLTLNWSYWSDILITEIM